MMYAAQSPAVATQTTRCTVRSTAKPLSGLASQKSLTSLRSSTSHVKHIKRSHRNVIQAVAAPERSDSVKETTIENDNKYLLQNYGPRIPIVFTHGEGCKLYSTEGKEFLDFAAGIAVNILGHSDPVWAEAVSDQATKLAHVSNLFHTVPGAELARRLCEVSFADRAFFCNTGTEANEGAIKFARKYALSVAEEGAEAAHELVSFSRGFHGRTMGALSLTANPKYKDPFKPLLSGVHEAVYGDLASAAAVIKKGKTAAVFIEPVQGEGGVFPAQKEFLVGLRKLCDEAGCLLVFDEVQCGLGRTGKMFGYEHYGVAPDMMTLAKPLAAGLPIGAVLMKEKVAASIAPGDHGSTFAGNPFVCRAALTVMDRVEDAGFMPHVNARGTQLLEGLREATAANAHVKEVRGLGLLVGIELDVPAGPAVTACRDAGLIVLTAGAGNVIRLAPPLIVNEAEVDQAIDIITKSLAALDA